MPLHDHFRPPMIESLAPSTLHVSWMVHLAHRLNEHWLPEPFRAREHSYSSSEMEIDIAAEERRLAPPPAAGGGAVTTLSATWAPPVPLTTGPAAFPDVIEVRVYEGPGSWFLVGAIEIVSRSNKNTPGRRADFLGKCATYLRSGVSVAVIDVVTDRHFNLHNGLLDLLGIPGGRMPAESHLIASAYRPVLREGREEIDVWAEQCHIGAELPTMPLRLTGDLFVPVEFELAYMETLEWHGVG